MINSMEKKNIPLTENQLLLENEELRQRVYEYEETLNSIRNGEIDAIVVSGVDGEKIYSLTSAETMYRIIIEEMNEGAITTSSDGLITYCNARFAELISEPTETLVGSYFINYLQKSEQPVFLDLLQSGLKGKIIGQIIYKLNSGHSLELKLSISPIPADIQNGVCILFSDITQLKQQEKELLLFNSRLDHEILEKTKDLARTNQELKTLHIVSMSMMEDAVEARTALEITNANLQKEIIERKQVEENLIITLHNLELSNKDLEQFAYVANHDLQEPLRMISSYTQLLERKYKDKLDQDATDYIHFAVNGAIRMQKLLNDLLEFSKINSHAKMNVQVDMSTPLGQAISNLQQLIAENNALITNDDLPVITADEAQIMRFFQNLIENAIKFKKKTELPKIHISCIRQQDMYQFSVADNGIGMEMQYHDRVFIVFQRLHSVKDYPGTGIGLSICKRIVERHGGTIWFESVVNQGTTFYFTIPVKTS